MYRIKWFYGVLILAIIMVPTFSQADQLDEAIALTQKALSQTLNDATLVESCLGFASTPKKSDTPRTPCGGLNCPSTNIFGPIQHGCGIEINNGLNLALGGQFIKLIELSADYDTRLYLLSAEHSCEHNHIKSDADQRCETPYVIRYDSVKVVIAISQKGTLRGLNGPENITGILPFCDSVHARWAKSLAFYAGPNHYVVEKAHNAPLDCKCTQTIIPDDSRKQNRDGYKPPQGNPENTLWHEEFPDYCTYWELYYWGDNGDGFLGSEDLIKFRMVETQDSVLEVIEDITPSIRAINYEGDSLYCEYLCYNTDIQPITDPESTYWHELWPNNSNIYVVSGWYDMDMNLILNQGDMLMLEGDGVSTHVMLTEDIATEIISRSTPWMPPCDYIIGDISGDGQRLGGDVTFGVRYFKGTGMPPRDSCYMDSTGTYLYVAADCNGNCEFRGSDITRLVSYFKGNSFLSCCHWFPTSLPRMLMIEPQRPGVE